MALKKNKNLKKTKITIKDYHYTCGDGCCDEFGYDIFINDERISSVNIFEDVLEAVLKNFGINAEISFLDHNGNVIK
jgi:hypothetical protein